MPKKNHNKIKPSSKIKNEDFQGIGIVCFLDLLGFSSSIFTDWTNTERNPVDRLLSIKAAPGIRTRGVSVQAHEGEGGSPIGQQFLPTVHSVSDSITLSIGLPSRATHNDLSLAFLSICLNARFVWQAAIQEGFVIRGGIELGPIYWSASEIIGPALINAYTIESKVAKTARVILGPQMLEELRKLKDDLGQQIKQLLMKCDDGLVALSPIHLAKNKEVGRDHTEKVRELRDSCDSQYNKSKYHELLKILEEPSSVSEPTSTDLDAARALFCVGPP